MHEQALIFSACNNCLTARKATVESLGYTFQTTAGNYTYALETSLPEIKPPETQNTTLFKEYVLLHAQLGRLKGPPPEQVYR